MPGSYGTFDEVIRDMIAAQPTMRDKLGAIDRNMNNELRYRGEDIPYNPGTIEDMLRGMDRLAGPMSEYLLMPPPDPENIRRYPRSAADPVSNARRR